MNNAVNLVVNNLADRLNEAVECIGTVSQTVVQETANVGFVYTMIGLIFIGMAGLILAFGCRKASSITDKQSHDNIMCGTIIITILMSFIGFIVVISSLNSWLAPTREVLREVVQNL